VSVINHLNEELSQRGRDAKRPTVIAQAYTHDVCFSLLLFGVDRIFSIANMKYSLLAFSALFPGFLSIINNLTIPSNYYNSRFSADNIVTRRSEYDWGGSFELVEIPVKTNTSDGMKKLTFSLCCRFLYEWSKGTTILVGIYDHAGCDKVVLNPLRNAVIGDCGSLFAICNNLEVTLAMLKTSNPKSVWRRQKVNAAQKESKMAAAAGTGASMESQSSSFWKDLYQDPNALSPTTSKFDAFGLSTAATKDFEKKKLTFTRHVSCYRKMKKKNQEEETAFTSLDHKSAPSSPGSSPAQKLHKTFSLKSLNSFSTAGELIGTASFGLRTCIHLLNNLVPNNSF
jgi:hypothetical protein